MKKVEFGSSARANLVKGIDILADAVVSTLGPNGRNVVIGRGILDAPQSTKDGVTVAKNIVLKDPSQELGVQLVKWAAIKTADKAGDGTTTSTLLARAMVKDGLKSLDQGENAVQIKRDIDTAIKEVLLTLTGTISEDISNEEQLEQIATVSANNDVEVGKLISTAIDKVGLKGVVHIESSKTGDTYIETVEGMQFDRGYKSPYFVTDNNTMTSVLENPAILMIDGKLNSVKELLPKEQTTIVDGKGEVEAIEKRIDELQAQIDKESTPYGVEQLQNRLSKFTGGVAIIHVGGFTETEMQEKKDRIDDSLHATKAAIEEGIVPGGGAALLYARESINNCNIGSKIVYNACGKPFEQILINAGYSQTDAQLLGKYQLVENGDNNWNGVDVNSGKVIDFKKAGIIDPTKVTRSALQNAASVAGSILLTECTITDDKDSDEFKESGHNAGNVPAVNQGF